MLESGVNTYISVDGADEIINSGYREFDDLACRWRVLDDVEKEIYLTSAMDEIENLVLTGSKLHEKQTLCFPRVGCYKENEIPQEVKQAQVENALALLGAELSRRSAEQIQTMSSLGALLNIKMNKKQQFDGDMLNGAIIPKRKRLTSTVAERLLKSWIGGNV